MKVWLISTLFALVIPATAAQGGVLGGYSPADPNSAEVVNAANFAVSSLDEAMPPYSFESDVSSGSGYTVIVTRAWQKVVAGVNYRMNIVIEDNSGECIGSFIATVYDQFGELSILKWGKESPCRSVPGGYSPTDPESPEVVNAANFAVSSLAEAAPPYSFESAVSSGTGYTVIVTQAWEQVVAGVNYLMDILIVDDTSGECIGSFTATVYDQFGTLSVTEWGEEEACPPPDIPVSGGYSPADPGSTQVVNAANFAVSSLDEAVPPYSFESDVSSGTGYTVIVTQAWQQVVAGVNYRMNILIVDDTSGECIGSFTATVYDQFGTLSVTEWGEEEACPPPDIPVSGGYSPADPGSTQVVNAANFAVSSLDEAVPPYSFESDVSSGTGYTVIVTQAWQQVVAGVNYRMNILIVDDTSGECIGSFTATVYDQFGTLSVTEWGDESPCPAPPAKASKKASKKGAGKRPGPKSGSKMMMMMMKSGSKMMMMMMGSKRNRN
jgi:hypothetical protein